MTIQAIKCGGGAAGEIETFAMANCLMLLSEGATTAENGQVFTCKTCGRKFPSFQALGGHRASHNKIKSSINEDTESVVTKSSAKPKSKTHACSICGLEFPIGQALGGHMRRHRPLINTHQYDKEKKRKCEGVVCVLKKSNSSKRVCVDLDLELNLSSFKYGVDVDVDDDPDFPKTEVEKEEKDFLKLELRQPINSTLSY